MTDLPWPDRWMLPTRANIDAVLAIVWAEDPDAAYYTDLETRAPVVVTRRNGLERVALLMPGFVWKDTPERTGLALVRALTL